MPSSSIPSSNPHEGCRIKVIGVGGGGGNAINRMLSGIQAPIQGVEMWAVNTDAQALDTNLAHRKLNIGNKTIARGLGAGGDPLIGTKAAEESSDEIEEMVKDADLIFVTAGMGGGTGYELM